MIGLGADIERISRFAKKRLTSTALQKVFTSRELRYCLSKARPAQHLAVRFAAKEAVVKALANAGAMHTTPEYGMIEVMSVKNGAPRVVLHGQRSHVPEIRITLAHAEDYALAVALVFSMREP